jgi:hypothetical protein
VVDWTYRDRAAKIEVATENVISPFEGEKKDNPPRYKTGDIHPEWNLAGFVEYCEHGREIWTSVCEDSEAPHRLARLSEQQRSQGECTCPCKKDTVHIPAKVDSLGQSFRDVRPDMFAMR